MVGAYQPLLEVLADMTKGSNLFFGGRIKYMYTLSGPTILQVPVETTVVRGLPVLLEVLVEMTDYGRGLPALLQVLVAMADNGRGLSASTESTGGNDT